MPTSLFLKNNGGDKKNCDHAYYPQGLLSSLYNLKTKMVHDFSFGSPWNERTEALTHLDKLGATDVLVYDRGYFSYALLHEPLGKGIDAIFRLPLGSFKVIDPFIKGLLDNLFRKVELVVAGGRNTQIATLERTSARSAACAYKSRPGRAYPRVFRQPVSKFQKKSKRSKPKTAATIG